MATYTYLYRKMTGSYRKCQLKGMSANRDLDMCFGYVEQIYSINSIELMEPIVQIVKILIACVGYGVLSNQRGEE